MRGEGSEPAEGHPGPLEVAPTRASERVVVAIERGDVTLPLLDADALVGLEQGGAV
jgi:hypothetical protein